MRSGGLLAFSGMLATAASFLAFTAGAAAAPLELEQVAADSTWLAHLDVDALRDSTVVQKAWRHLLEKHKDAEDKLAFVRGVLGMDVTKDIHGLTFYGKQIGKPQGVLIVSGAWDPERLKALSGLLPGRESTTHGDYKIASWQHTHHEHKHTTAVALHGKEHLVVAGSVDDLKDALDVLDGKGKGLAAEASLAGRIPPGTVFLLRVEGVDDAKLPCDVPLLKQLESLRLVDGEHEGESFIRARLKMTNPEAAKMALLAVEGRKAENALLCPDELGRRLVAAINPKLDDSTLTLLWSAPADDVWNVIQKIEKLIAKHHAKHAKHAEQRGKGHCPLCEMAGGKCPFCKDKPAADDKPSQGEKKAVSPEEDF